eukprot:TRINITY_DN10074_c0_g1_i1.p1 TRINITY_DN10074_c0_g1~~TRINITY_DN10074_c0_g1_i1.p1  ORF type:complete len:695 (+),score=74.73 TRINITY_DN10074_c0_g1_i1:113-2197(+)
MRMAVSRKTRFTKQHWLLTITFGSVVLSSDATTTYYYETEGLDMAVLGFYDKEDAANNRSHCQASHRLQDGWSILFAYHPAPAVKAMAQAGSWGGTKLCSVSANDTFECVNTGIYAGSYAGSGRFGEPAHVKHAVISGESIRLGSDYCDYNLIIARVSSVICDALENKLGGSCSNWHAADGSWAFHLQSAQGLAYREWALSWNSDYSVTKLSGPQVQNVCALVALGDGQDVKPDCVALQGSSALMQCGDTHDDRCSEQLQSTCEVEAFPACCKVSWPYVQNVSCCHLRTSTRMQCYWKELTCYYSSRRCIAAMGEDEPVCRQPASEQCGPSTWRGWPSTTSTSKRPTTTATTQKRCAAEHQLTVSITVECSTNSSLADLQHVVHEVLGALLNIPAECIVIVPDATTNGVDRSRQLQNLDLSVIQRKVTVILSMPLDEFNRAKELFSTQGQAGATSVESAMNDKLRRDGHLPATLRALSVNNDVFYDVGQASGQPSTTNLRPAEGSKHAEELAEGSKHAEDDALLTVLLTSLGACCFCCFFGGGIFIITVKLRGRKRDEGLPTPKKQTELGGKKTLPEDPETPPTARHAWPTDTERSVPQEVSSTMTQIDASIQSPQDSYRRKQDPPLKSRTEDPNPTMVPPTPARDVHVPQSQSTPLHFARKPDETSPPQLNFISKPAMNAFERSRQHRQSPPF